MRFRKRKFVVIVITLGMLFPAVLKGEDDAAKLARLKAELTEIERDPSQIAFERKRSRARKAVKIVESDIELVEVYAALKLVDLKLAHRRSSEGDVIRVEYSLRNTSGSNLTVPASLEPGLTTNSTLKRSRHVGRVMIWIQRAGREKELFKGRRVWAKGNWRGVGHEIVRTGTELNAEEAITVVEEFSTADLPSDTYDLRVEYVKMSEYPPKAEVMQKLEECFRVMGCGWDFPHHFVDATADNVCH